jgi:hypothetical protein
MRVNRGREADTPSERRGPTFTGEVWAEPVLATGDGVTVNTVFFAPAARTHWHHHERGQILLVTHGRGLPVSDDAIESCSVGRDGSAAGREPVGRPRWLEPKSSGDTRGCNVGGMVRGAVGLAVPRRRPAREASRLGTTPVHRVGAWPAACSRPRGRRL